MNPDGLLENAGLSDAVKRNRPWVAADAHLELARMHGINIRAVILASLAVFGVDLLSSVVLINVFGGPTFDSSMTDEQISAAMQVLLQDSRYLTIGLILGTLSTVLGGFLAASFARAVPYFNALAFGVLGLVVSVLTIAEVPTWFKVIGFALTVPAALLGGHLAKQRLDAEKRRRPDAP
jgi:hypothetical protein